MQFLQAYHWLVQSERRKKIILDFDQPLTATHVARRTGISFDSCLHLLWGMTLYGILYCLNPDAQYNRLHWLTEMGKACQRRLRQSMGLAPLVHNLPNVPWDLFSAVCFTHRAAVVKAMQGPMQAAAIKRRAILQNARLRMSANNARDVMGYLLKLGIVRKGTVEGRAHPHFELTDLGRALQGLLVGARAYNGTSGVA